MMNHVSLMGRLTRDPELRRTQSGTAVASFTLAVDRDFTDKATGNRQTDFIDLVAWRGAAEFLAKHFTKGQMAAVEGRIEVRNWQDRDGNKRRSTEVVVKEIYFAGYRPAPAGAAAAAETAPMGYAEPDGALPEDYYEDALGSELPY